MTGAATRARLLDAGARLPHRAADVWRPTTSALPATATARAGRAASTSCIDGDMRAAPVASRRPPGSAERGSFLQGGDALAGDRGATARLLALAGAWRHHAVDGLDQCEHGDEPDALRCAEARRKAPRRGVTVMAARTRRRDRLLRVNGFDERMERYGARTWRIDQRLRNAGCLAAAQPPDGGAPAPQRRAHLPAGLGCRTLRPARIPPRRDRNEVGIAHLGIRSPAGQARRTSPQRTGPLPEARGQDRGAQARCASNKGPARYSARTRGRCAGTTRAHCRPCACSSLGIAIMRSIAARPRPRRRSRCWRGTGVDPRVRHQDAAVGLDQFVHRRRVGGDGDHAALIAVDQVVAEALGFRGADVEPAGVLQRRSGVVDVVDAMADVGHRHVEGPGLARALHHGQVRPSGCRRHSSSRRWVPLLRLRRRGGRSCARAAPRDRNGPRW